MHGWHTLQQIAVVGGLNVDFIVNRLRSETGQSTSEAGDSDKEYLSADPPSWFDVKNIRKSFDATPIINSGGSPMNEILQETSHLKQGEILELKTPFIPAPIIDILKGKDFRIFCVQNDKITTCYIAK